MNGRSNLCSKYKIKFVDPKVSGSGPGRVAEMTETTTANANAMDTVNITDAGALACTLDPDATVFIPAESQVSQVTSPKVPMTQLPNSQLPPSQSPFHNLNK